MRILFITIGDVHSIHDKGIYPDLLRKFREKGHEVSVVCVRERRLHLSTELQEEYGIAVLRVRTLNLTKTSLIEKGIATILTPYQFIHGIKKHFKKIKFDLVLYSTPPITVGKVVAYVKNRDGALSYLLLKDIFPQNAIDLGLFSKKSMFYQYFRTKEKRLYKISDYIGCMSQGNVDYIIGHNVLDSNEKVELCPNSIEVNDMSVFNTKKEIIRERYGIPLSKTVFIYGGNLGRPQGIDYLIQCLKAQECNSKAFFVIVGAGTEFPKLQSYMQESRPEHVLLLPMLSASEYQLLAASCDVGLIFLDYKFTVPNIPSRLLLYMQVKLPVFAVTDPNTDLGSIIEEGAFGWWCKAKEVEAFNDQITLILNHTNLLKDYGTNAYRYLESHYSTDISYGIIMKHVRQTEKLLMLSQCFYPSKNRGGSTISTINLVKSLNRDFNISVITTYYEMGTGEPYSEVAVGKNRLFHSDVYYLNNNRPGTVLKHIRKIRPGVIFVSSIFSVMHSLPAMLYQKYSDKRVRLILSPRGELLNSALSMKSFKKKLFLKVITITGLINKAEFHATSEEELKELKQIFPGSTLHYIRDLNITKNTNRYEKPRKEKGTLKILTTGRVHPIKNIDKAIEILSNVTGEVQFDIYGPKEDPAYFNECMKRAEGLSKQIKVEYKGSISHELIPEVISNYHLFLSPSRNENFGHSIIEAMQCSCPVIISDRTPWQNLEKNKAGYSIDLEDLHGFVKAVQYFIDMNDTEYQEWCQQTRQYINKQLNIQGDVEAYRRLFQRKVQNPPNN